MAINTIEKGQDILKKHYDLQLEIAKKTKYEKDIFWVTNKYSHSQDVFNMAKYLIANDENLKNLDEKYKMYGELSALLHDIGRCYEIGDKKLNGISHGIFGADNVLVNMECENNPFILIPVKYHDTIFAEKDVMEELEKYVLTSEEKEIAIILLKLTMDSDKLANFGLFQDVERRFFLSLKKEPYITEDCFIAFKNRTLIKREARNTIFDQIISYMAWVYDLNFETSKKFMLQKNYMRGFVDMLEGELKEIKTKNINISKSDISNLNEKFSEIKKQLIADNFML